MTEFGYLAHENDFGISYSPSGSYQHFTFDSYKDINAAAYTTNISD